MKDIDHIRDYLSYDPATGIFENFGEFAHTNGIAA